MATDSTSAPSSYGWDDVLLDAHAYIGGSSNGITARGFTRNKKVIEASFCLERPPLPSRLYLRCPDLGSSAFSEIPRILCMVEGLILIRVAVGCREPDCIFMEECDYFIYRVDRPSLERLPHPYPIIFQDDDVGLLPRGDLYTVAALVATESPTVFTLHLLHSEIGSWTSIEVPLEAPQEEFPMEIPRKACRLLSHYTDTVITIGGEGGTMGWADLWRGILLCDVLHPDPALRGVPLPLPKAQLMCNDGKGIELGCSKPYRGISFVKGKGCLRFVNLDIRGKRLHDLDKETEKVSIAFDGWAITTWSNSNMTSSFGDWVMDRQPVQAKNINCSNNMRAQMREYQLLRPMPPRQGNGVAAIPEPNVQNLWVSQPIPSMGGKNVVYLMTGAKFLHPKACVLAVDMEKIKLQGVAEFGSERELGAGVICCPGSVSGSFSRR